LLGSDTSCCDLLRFGLPRISLLGTSVNSLPLIHLRFIPACYPASNAASRKQRNNGMANNKPDHKRDFKTVVVDAKALATVLAMEAESVFGEGRQALVESIQKSHRI
jgi:hypothetical protein